MMAQLVSSELFLGLFEEANIIKLEQEKMHFLLVGKSIKHRTAGTWLETVGGEFPFGHYQQ